MNGDLQKLLNSVRGLLENDEENNDLDLSLGEPEEGTEGEEAPEGNVNEPQDDEGQGELPEISGEPGEDVNQMQAPMNGEGSDDTISTSREEIMKVVDQGLKAGQKVHIIIGSEGKDPTIEIANMKKKAPVNKKVAPKKNVEQSNEMSNVMLQTLSILANKVAELNDKVNVKTKVKTNATDEKKVAPKKNVVPTNEDVLVNQIEGLTLKLSEMEARLAAKDSIGYYNESYDNYDHNFEELSNALDEAYDGINQLIESVDVLEEQENRLNAVYRANVLSKVLLECNNRFVVPFKMGINNLNNAILSEVADIENSIKTDLEQEINESLDSFSRIMAKISLAEKINAMDLTESTKSDIINLIEQSQMSETSDGYDEKYAKESNAITAPEYIDKKFDNGTVKPSQMSDNNNDGYSNKSMNVYRLPVKKNFDTGKVTINSAISAIAECFTDEDGKLNVDQVQHAFLYQKSARPKKLDDFAIPLATIHEGKLVAVPKFIEFAAKTLINESKCHIYGIPGSNLEALRAKILPYLNELNIAAPWDN